MIKPRQSPSLSKVRKLLQLEIRYLKLLRLPLIQNTVRHRTDAVYRVIDFAHRRALLSIENSLDFIETCAPNIGKKKRVCHRILSIDGSYSKFPNSWLVPSRYLLLCTFFLPPN